MMDPGEIKGIALGLRDGWLHPLSHPGDFEPPDADELAAMFPGLRDFVPVGRGGMGAVFRAEQPGLSRTVAVKIIPLDAGDPTAAERFLREAKVLAALDHPNVVRVFDAGQNGGFGWLVMEFVEGGTLAALAEVPPPRAFTVIRQVAAALQHAHDRGLVHRDVKPANVLLTPDGTAKLGDFGLARPVAAGQAATSLTLTGYIAGTLDYMAPEQRRPGAAVDHRADIFSLGAMLYQLLTSRLPMGQCEAPSTVRPGACSVSQDAAVMKAMAYEPAQRFASVTEFITALDAQTPRRRMVPLLAAAVLAVAGGTGWWVWKRSPSAVPVTPAGPATFTNSLGMSFVSVPGSNAMFCTNETRLADFTAFADETKFQDHVMSAFTVKDGKTISAYEGRSWRSPGWQTTGAHPVTGVNWRDAKLFCEWLTDRERASGLISARQSYRLPTDAEWTLAAGLDSARAAPPRVGEGNFADASFARSWPGMPALAEDDGFTCTSPAGSFPANALGLHDTRGNVWEWTADLTVAGQGVFRGGSWTNADLSPHGTEIRVMWDANLRSQDIGFRCVLAEEAVP